MYVCSEYDRKEKRKKDDGSESFPVLVLFFLGFFMFYSLLKTFCEVVQSKRFVMRDRGLSYCKLLPLPPHTYAKTIYQMIQIEIFSRLISVHV